MIISASRRTDIPAFYSQWFINRLREKYVLVPNPYNTKHLSRIPLSPEIIDCIVFWTKNPAPLLHKLSRMEELGYKNYYFEFTVTAYNESIEKRLPPKSEIIETFRRLSDRIGANRVDWRFDPILLNEHIKESLILDRFEKMCKQIASYTTKCIISFIDEYKHIGSVFKEIPEDKQAHIIKHLAKIASAYNLRLYACGEKQDFSSYGIHRSACIDKEKIENITGYKLLARKDTGQRKNCGCIESVDIGTYNTCHHACAYCYAVRHPGILEKNKTLHDPCAPLMIGKPDGKEIIVPKIGKSLKNLQRSFMEEDTD